MHGTLRGHLFPEYHIGNDSLPGRPSVRRVRRCTRFTWCRISQVASRRVIKESSRAAFLGERDQVYQLIRSQLTHIFRVEPRHS